MMNKQPLRPARKELALSRRGACIALSCAAGLFFSRGAAAGTAGADDESWNTPYRRLVDFGEFGRPTKTVRVQGAHGESFSVWSPAKKTRLTGLIIFSHAELELPESYDALLSHWASHGYVVIAPIHDDSVARDGLYDLTNENNQNEGAQAPAAIFYQNTSFGRKRAKLCSYVLDIIPTFESAIKNDINDSRPIIAGHNLGAYAAQLIVGAKAVEKDGSEVGGKDDRYYAGLLLSPQGRGILGLTADSWRSIDRPIFVSTGNGDSDATLQTPDRKTDPFLLSPPKNRHLAWLGRVSETLWGGESADTNPVRKEIFNDILASTTGFIKAYGGYDEDMLKLISGDYLDKSSDNRIAMFYR